MTREELLARDTRVHLVIGEIQACPAPADGLSQTTEPMWSTCAACLAGFDRLREALAAEARLAELTAPRVVGRVA